MSECDEGRKAVELYDHEKDSREFTKLASDLKYAKAVDGMKQVLLRGFGQTPGAHP